MKKLELVLLGLPAPPLSKVEGYGHGRSKELILRVARESDGLNALVKGDG